MSRSLSNLRRGLLGIAVVGSLGFGVTQAFAAPAQASKRNMCSREMDAYCDYSCGLDGLRGYCNGSGPYMWCECYVG